MKATLRFSCGCGLRIQKTTEMHSLTPHCKPVKVCDQCGKEMKVKIFLGKDHGKTFESNRKVVA